MFLKCVQNSGGGTINPTVIKYGYVSGTNSVTQSISSDKHYIVCGCDKGGTGYRSGAWYISGNTATLLYKGDLHLDVTVSNNVITVIGTGGSYDKDYQIIQLD